MIDWQTIKPIISAQFARLAEVPGAAVRWVDEPSGLINGVLPVVWLRVTSVVQRGIEEERIQLGGDTDVDDDLDMNVTAPREFTLSIRCESFTSDISDPKYSGNVLDKIMLRVMRASSREERANSFAIAKRLGTRWISYIEAGRPISAHIGDLLCNTVDNDVETTIGSGGWIGEALVSGPVNDTNGNLLGSVNVDAKAD